MKTKNRFTGIICMLAVLISIFSFESVCSAASVTAAQPVGSGSIDNPYAITQPSELIWLSNQSNSSSSSALNAILMNNIDMSNVDFTAIGKDASHTYNYTFNGNNKTISNLNTSGSNGSMLGVLGKTGIVTSLTLAGDVALKADTTYTNVGIVGSNSGLIENCVNNVNITGNTTSNIFYLGGIAGYSTADGRITGCVNNGTITITDTGYPSVGGIVGITYGIIENCSNNAKISGSNYIGGIAAGCDNTGSIKNCFNTAELTLSGNGGLGGIVGNVAINTSGCNIRIENCYNTGNLFKNDSNYDTTTNQVGAIAADLSNYYSTSGISIINCYNTANITIGVTDTAMSNTAARWGGICATTGTNTIVERCYHTGTVSIYNSSRNTNASVGAAAQTKYVYSLKGALETVSDMEVFLKADEFTNGKAAFLLNQDLTVPVYYQNINSDAYPVLDPSHNRVYEMITSCGGLTVKPDRYSNIATEMGFDEHEFNQNGVCVNCGMAYERAAKNSNGVYEISNAGQLAWFSQMVAGTSVDGTEKNSSANAILTNDVDMSGVCFPKSMAGPGAVAWTPIGLYESSKRYTGTFDGQGHTVKNLQINNNTATYQGLFGYIYTGASVSNIVMEDVYIYADSYIGAIAGKNNAAKIENCLVKSGYIKGYNSNNTVIGGIVGEAMGPVSNCGNNADISGGGYVGGITGWMYKSSSGANSDITNCYSSGKASGTYYWTGAIAGIVESTAGAIINCYAKSYSLTAPKNTFDNKNLNVVITGGGYKNAAAFASGEVCSLLNSNITDGTQKWYQTVGTDNYPVLFGKTVFYDETKTPAYYNKPDIEITGYSNNTVTVESLKNVTATLVFAAYSSGKLIGVDILDKTSVSVGSNVYNPTDKFSADGADKIEIMLWESVGSMKPVCAALNVILQ